MFLDFEEAVCWRIQFVRRDLRRTCRGERGEAAREVWVVGRILEDAHRLAEQRVAGCTLSSERDAEHAASRRGELGLGLQVREQDGDGGRRSHRSRWARARVLGAVAAGVGRGGGGSGAALQGVPLRAARGESRMRRPVAVSPAWIEHAARLWRGSETQGHNGRLKSVAPWGANETPAAVTTAPAAFSDCLHFTSWFHFLGCLVAWLFDSLVAFVISCICY